MAHEHSPSSPDQPRRVSAGEPLVTVTPPSDAHIDPVCGMTVDPTTARATHSHDGQTYYFCCPSCREKFKTAPECQQRSATGPKTRVGPGQRAEGGRRDSGHRVK